MAWMAAAWFIYHATLENVPGSTSSPGAFLSALFGTSQGWRMIVVGNLVGFGFALLTLAVSVVSFPMAVDKPVNWGVAVRTSCRVARSEEHTSELQSLMRISYAVFCLNKKKITNNI